MTTEDQLKRWHNELQLMEKANPDVCYPVMPMESGDSVFEVLETRDWMTMYYFYET